MRILAYSCRPDEREFFDHFAQKYQVEVVLTDQEPSPETAELARGFECISTVADPMPAELLEKFKNVGVRFISTRTIGFDHIDVKAAHQLGLEVGNVSYSASSVADYAIMLMLMTLRNAKTILEQTNIRDYSLDALRGRELPYMTVGVMGAGKIGQTVLKHLSGFGCRLLAYDLYENQEAKRYATFVPLETLLAESDIITLHIPATEKNRNFINKETIAKMKDGAIIINTARGSLVNSCDLIEAISQKKLGGAALDVFEKEEDIFHNDLTGEIVDAQELAVLQSFPNVIVTPHIAFYTDRAVSDMVENSIQSCLLFIQGKDNPWQLPHKS